MERSKRTIIAQKKRVNYNNPNLGIVEAIAESLDEGYESLTNTDFCETGEVFITANYQANIDEKFKEGEFFKLHVHESLNFNDNKSDAIDSAASRCKYVANGTDVEKLMPKDIVQIINVEKIPDPNLRFIESETYPGTTYIYLRDQSFSCYGPFKWSVAEAGFNILLIDAPFPVSKNLPKSHIFKFDISQFANCVFDDNGYIFIYNMVDVHNKAEPFDYSSDEDVVKYFIQQTNESGLRVERVQLASLEAALKRSPKSHAKTPLFRKNFDRLHDIVNQTNSIRSEIAEGIQKFFKSDAGIEIVSAFVLKHENKYLEDIKNKRKEEIQLSIQDKSDELKNLELQKQNLSNELKDINKKIEENKEQVSNNEELHKAGYAKKLDGELLSKQMQLDDINKKMNELSEKYAQFKKLDDLEQQIEKNYSTLDGLNAQKIRLENIEEDLISRINTSKDKLQERLMELKPYVDAINGAFIFRDLNIPEVYIATKNIDVSGQSKIDRQIAVIDAILSNIRKKDEIRLIQPIDLANLLICTQQSFVTFLAGLPGVGKTSLSRLFVDGQGVGSRFKEVAVSRGWTSQKDLIGFFNPLTSRFQPSQTGLYQFLYALHEEVKVGIKNSPMAYILLDEANLSPIEHYWAIFMGMTDTKENMTVQLGQEVIKIPDHLRFIATINYDSTTEPLSPRIIDRAPIIVLDGSLNDFQDAFEESLHELPLSAKNLEDLFGCIKAKVDFDDSEFQAFKKIHEVLNSGDKDSGRPIHLSARKVNSIKQYCSQARAIMRHLSLNQDNSDIIALDFAVLQFVLPQIKGNGIKFKKRLELLLSAFQDHKLKKSAEYLEHMIRYGEDELHTYDFFCW